MKISLPTVLAAASLAAFAGCASPGVARVPPPAAFAAPIEQVLVSYPEAAPLFPAHTRAGDVATAPASVLVDAWGPPIEKQRSLWNLWPGNWLFGPQSVWTWRLAGHRVECGIEQPLTRGLEPIAGEFRRLD